MKTYVRAFLIAFALAMSLFPAVGQAEGEDSAQISRRTATIGEQFTIVISVLAPEGAVVELDLTSPSWSGVEVVRIENQIQIPEQGGARHTIAVVAAGFFPGDRQAIPAVVLTRDGTGEQRLLPALQIMIASTLPVDAPLELSPLAGPVAIEGAESPWLRPAIGAGVVLTAALAAAIIYFLGRALLRRRPLPSLDNPVPIPAVDLDTAEGLLISDPVRAYRTLAATIRHVIAERYGVPATALTTREIQGRMETHGVDRWQARLVSGLLQECEAVVYAGYLPASERRQADLSMAREIVAGLST